ncbi:hypothetical protein JCM10295v2_002637 [Rhodotorula toruloides]
MFAPAAPLARAVSKARSAAHQTASEIQSDLHVAERLHAEATHPEDEGQEVPEDLDADEAEEVIEDEYRPLMDGEEGEEGHGGSRANGKGTKGKRQRWDEEGGETKVRKFEVWLAQLIFFILGACILLSWNTEIVAGAYFGARLVGSPFQTSFASFVALTFTTANLAFLAHANATQGGANLSRRIQVSIVTLIVVLVIFIVSTQVEEIPANLFFSYLIVSAIILAASASYLQNAVVALSASFGPRFLNQILSGQGAIAFAVAGIQFAAAYGAVKNHKPESRSSAFRLQADYSLSTPQLVANLAAVPPPAVRQTAFTFFLTVGIFAAVSLVSYWVLLRLPLYRLVIRASFDEDAATTKSKQAASSISLRVVERKVRHLGIAMFLIFAVTLAVFPSITATIVSVRTGEPDLKLFQRPELFVPLGFAVFAAGDWLGRVMPQWEKLAWTNWKILMGISIARLVFVPLFLMCNQTAGGGGRAIIRSDVAFFLIMFAFAISNGYISTLIMLASVVEPSLEQEEIEVAATCLAFYLTAGLSAGSFLSFAVRAAICRCNPFV